jgi:hypothetical protein
MSEIKLLPCPFCGGEFQINVGGMIYIPKCKKCGCTLAGCRTEEEAIEEVNTRKPMERILTRLEKLPYAEDDGFVWLEDAKDVVKEEGGIE